MCLFINTKKKEIQKKRSIKSRKIDKRKRKMLVSKVFHNTMCPKPLQKKHFLSIIALSLFFCLLFYHVSCHLNSFSALVSSLTIISSTLFYSSSIFFLFSFFSSFLFFFFPSFTVFSFPPFSFLFSPLFLILYFL